MVKSQNNNKTVEYVNVDMVPKLFFIEWNDHSGFEKGGWHGLDEVYETIVPVICASVGWCYKEEEDHIVLIPVVTQDKATMGAQCILKADIIRAVELVNPLEKEDYGAIHRKGQKD